MNLSLASLLYAADEAYADFVVVGSRSLSDADCNHYSLSYLWSAQYVDEEIEMN